MQYAVTNLVKRKINALTLIELLFVIAVLALVVTILLPGLSRPHAHAPRQQCVYNLKQIGLAFRTWALDHEERFPMQVSETNGGTMELVANGLAYMHFQVI